MPLQNNSTPQSRKQQIRIRESTALQPAEFVESPPLLKNEIVDIEYEGSGSPTRRVSKRPRVKTNKITELEETWTQKKVNKGEAIHDGNQSKYNRKKEKTEIISPPLKRIKLSKPGPMTSILKRPFDRTQITEEMKQKIIKNQPIVLLQRVNECIISVKSKKTLNKAAKANQRATTPITSATESVVREPVFIAVEDDNIESTAVPLPSDNNDTNISSSVMCRLCGVAGPNRFSLIGMRSERFNLLSHLKQYLNIEIFDEENLPLHVCPLCSQTIISFYKFHNRVKTATNRLQAIVNESTSNPQRTWESVPWYGDNILATATATNDYLTKKHLRKLEQNKKGKTKNATTKFVTTNIEKLFGNKNKSNGINPNLLVEEHDDEDTEDADDDVHDKDWAPTESTSIINSTPKPRQVYKNIEKPKNQIETITINDDDEPTVPKIVTTKSTPQPVKLQTVPRFVLSKPPTMTPKPTTIQNTIPLLNTTNITGDNSSGPKTYLIPIQNLVGAGLTGLNQGSPLKIALSSTGQPILLQSTGANTVKLVPNTSTTDKNIASKPLATIKGISNKTIITSPPVNVNQIITTSNTSIPIKTISPVATIVPNTSSTIIKPIPSSTIVVSQPNVQPKPIVVDNKSPKLKQSLSFVKPTSNPSTTSESSTKLVTTLKSTPTKSSTAIRMPVTRTLEKISTPISMKTTSSPTPTKSAPTSTKPASTPVSFSTKIISTTTKPTSTPQMKDNPLWVSKNVYVNKGKTLTATSTTSSTLKTVGSPIGTPSTSKEKPEIPDCLPLDPAEEKELNANIRPPSKDDKYTYVVRMDRNVGEQPYFILTANPIKLKTPELTKHNVGIICKDVYKAEVEKKRIQENEGNFSNIGLHCWAQHIVWLWQLKLPGNVCMYVKQSADKILQFGQRKRIDYAKKCYEVSKQICKEAVIKSINQSPQVKKPVVVASPTLPKLIPKDAKIQSKDILPKLIPKEAPVTNLLPKLLPKDSTSNVATTQQLVLIPVTDKSKTGNSSVSYVLSTNSNVKFQNSNTQNILSNIKLVPSTGASKQQAKPPSDLLQNVTLLNAENYETINEHSMDIVETVEVSTSDMTTTEQADDANKKTEEANKIQLVYTDDDKEGEGMFDMECVSEDDEHDTSNNDNADDILKQATLDAFGTEEAITIDDNTPNVQIETVDFDPTTSEMVNLL